MSDLTHCRLCELLKYDPQTGKWRWLKTRRGIAAGPAGCINTDGYLVVRIDGILYYGHRLAWFYMKREWPPFEIDHKNTTPGDDRWDNLRPATHAQNQKNSKKYRSNTSGSKGVSRTPNSATWRASIRVDGQQIHLGCFPTKDGARQAYIQASTEHHGAFARPE